MQDLILGLKKSNSERKERRSEMGRISHYAKLFRFLESRFEDGETYKVKNFSDCYKMTVKDMEGNDKVVYGFIAENSDRTYLSLNDIAFPKKLYKREIKKVDGEEITTYTQLENKVFQGDLAVLFDKFKSQYKDALLAFDLLYIALAEHNESKFTAESFIYPTEIFQRFKGEYVTSNFYLFNLQIGGTSEEKLNEIFDKVCKFYEESLKEAEAPAEDMNIKQIEITLSDVLSSDNYMKDIPLIEEWSTDKNDKLKIEVQCEVESDDDSYEIKDTLDIKPEECSNGQHNGHEWIDLGLPSCVKWATCNLGASSPTEYGNYYAWGETIAKDKYRGDNSLTWGRTVSDLQCQGYIDEEGKLNSSHDAATANWGGDWRMPTEAELNELEEECTWESTTLNGVDGKKVTGPNGNSIFLPFAGYRCGLSLHNGEDYGIYGIHGLHGNYWGSHTPVIDSNNKHSFCLYCSEEEFQYGLSICFRFLGLSVRPVLTDIKELDLTYQIPSRPSTTPPSSGGCYVATAIYGSYDCPEVWTLRRFRDFTLAESWYGRAFIKTYYAISPTLVRWFGKTSWFKNLLQKPLDNLIKRLQDKGVEHTPYNDRIW